MSRFNTTASLPKTTNRAGGEAYVESPKLALVSLLLTSFAKDQFYRSASGGIGELKNLINVIDDKTFVAKAILFARNEFGMRSISHVAAAEIAYNIKGADWTKRFFDAVIHRPDDMTEILSYYQTTYGKTEPNALKKGFAKALSRFDEYQLAKYRGSGKGVSLVDVVNLVHPKPTEAITKLVRDELRNEATFEAKLSKAGQEKDSDAAKTEAWAELIGSRRIGYFALLRNLRNIIEQAPNVLDDALELLTDEKLIRKSLVLPFRYQTALEEIRKCNGAGVTKTMQALNRALDISVVNVPKFDGETLVVLDASGSMGGQPAEIGSLFSAILVKANQCDFMTFGSAAHYRSINPDDSTMTIAKSMRFNEGGTNFNAIFTTANRAYDRIIVLSDMQGWEGYHTPNAAANDYKKRTGANPKIYSFDLAGHGSLQFPEPNVYAIAGFSDKVLDLMKLLETDRNALIKKIEAVAL